MIRKLACLAAALFLTACASISRQVSFADPKVIGPDAVFADQGREWKVWVHRQEKAVMIQITAGAAFTSGLTFGLADTKTYGAWQHALDTFLEPSGCSESGLKPIQESVAWEAQYSCPAGVDLLELVRAQRSTLTQGQPLRR